MNRPTECHILFVNKHVCVRVRVSVCGRPYRRDVIRCDWTAMTVRRASISHYAHEDRRGYS